MAYDVMDTAGSVYGIVGMGIGLGVLAGTSRMVMRSMDRGFGMKDASQRGWKTGGRGRYRTDVCRHPQTRKKSTKKRTQNGFYNPYLDQPKFSIGRY